VAQDEGQALRTGGFEQLEIGAAAGHPEETLHAGPAQALDEDVGDGGHQRRAGRITEPWPASCYPAKRASTGRIQSRAFRMLASELA
jgi:hypothetical protein